MLDYTLNFAGGVTSSGSFILANWKNPGASGVFNSFGRINLADEYNSEAGNLFSLYTANLEISEENSVLRLEIADLRGGPKL